MLTGLILAVELVGGFLSHSLALLSDAGHVFADVIALSLSWYGVRQAERPASSRMTYGYHRVGVLVALFNAVSIFAIAVVIFYEAYRRWLQPPEVNSPLMLAAALVGLVVNVFIAFWLRGEQQSNLNVRSAFWHVLGDALASVGVIIGAIIIMLTGWFIVDPIISVLIGFIITFAAWRILKEGFKVLLEAVPHQIDVERMAQDLQKIPGVKGVHDVHVWSISPELHAMSCHVLVDDMRMSQAQEIREQVETVLRQRFDIEHSALQMECQECAENDLFCSLKPCSPDEDHEHHD
ncbi:MAG TPA: cation transporter [Dehalococcoidia bacterium]|nr:cation transporter [Dehalococcoidia bacterium]